MCYCWYLPKKSSSQVKSVIRHLKKKISHPSAFPKVLSAATIVAKHTSALCNACRLASSKTSNPVAKRQFVQSAKEVANSTANLVKSIKVSANPKKFFKIVYENYQMVKTRLFFLFLFFERF